MEAAARDVFEQADSFSSL